MKDYLAFIASDEMEGRDTPSRGLDISAKFIAAHLARWGLKPVFYRSDHYNYARKGIPIIFYMDGVHDDYHRPSDSVEKIDYQNMEKVTRTIYATAWELGNRAARPRVDKPLPAAGMGN